MNLLSVDPGIRFTGTSILQVDNGGKIKVIYVETIIVENQIKRTDDIVTIYGERYAKQLAIATQISKLIDHYDVPYVVSEAPFLKPGRSRIFESLVGILAVVRHTIQLNHYGCLFETIDPKTVKMSVGVHAGSKDKNDMAVAVKKLPITWDKEIDINSLDEHSIDSIAVGYSKCAELITF